MTKKEYEELKARVAAKLKLEPWAPTEAQKADWAYGNARLENPLVTSEMAARAAKRK